jgi:hypothetical protein
MIAQFISHHDARWKEFLKRTNHDFYDLPEYAELAAAEEDAIPMAFYAENRSAACLIPLLIRPIPAVLNAPRDWCDCVSPYGYPGILLSPSQEELHSFLDAFCHIARERGIVTAFVRLHPLFPLAQGSLEKFGQVVHHGPTVYINLSDSKEHIWQQMSTNHQRDIKRLIRLGFHSTVDDWSRFHEFIALYHANMQRVGAKEQYFFSLEHFEDLRAKLGNRVHLICVLSSTNELAAAGLMIITEGIAQHHLGATAAQYLRRSPSKLVVDFMWRWAQEQSCYAFHFGGGVGAGEDSLFHFKAGFSPTRGQFYSYRVVVDESKNATLNQAAKHRICGLGSSDFFPGYRHLAKQDDSALILR